MIARNHAGPQPLEINPDDPRLRPVAQLAEKATGRRPTPATVWRWCRKGTARNGLLPAVNVFGSWYSTAEAFAEWMMRSVEAAPADDPPAERPEATRRRLEKAGLLPRGKQSGEPT